MFRSLAFIIMLALLGVGCSLPVRGPDKGLDSSLPLTEPAWIRNGDPIEIEKGTWHPTDEVERLLDGEMFPIGRYRDTVVYIERVDIKPYDRVYTRFEKNRYRVFELHN